MTVIDRINSALKAFRNPYAETQNTEATFHQAIEENVLRDLKQFGELSAELLQDKRYGKLAALFQRILEQNLRLLIWYDVPEKHLANLVQVYYDAMRRFQMQVRVLSQMVSIPKEFTVKAQEAQLHAKPVNPAKAYTNGS